MASLIFMPDISGFTQFVQSVEIEHSQHIISELLELLIDQNELGLELAEIEGDALFYFKFRDVPTPEKVLKQARQMFRAFHKHLTQYETNRICQCGACISATNLKLKFIIHGGEFDFVRVKEIIKPHGAEVIKAHRLMKNNVESDEYILVSDDLKQIWESRDAHLTGDFTWSAGSEMLDLGEVRYWFAQIEEWKANLESIELPVKKGKETLLFTSTIEIARDLDLLFELISNLKYREKWFPGVDQVDYKKGRVNRRGEKHVCVIGRQDVVFETLKPDLDKQGRRIFAERTVSVPTFRYIDFYFAIQQTETASRVKVQVVGSPAGPWSFLLKPLIAGQMKKQMARQLASLKDLAESQS